MSELKVEVDPAEVGLDPDRLQRIGRHFGRYVDDGKLAGWLITVNRRGQLAYVAQQGSRDLASSRPVETDTLWRIYSMSKPITAVAAMICWEEGAFELNDPVSKFIPSFENVRVFTGGTDMRPDLRVPALPPGRRRLPGPRVRVGLAARHRPGHGLRRLGRHPAAVPAGQRVELLGID
jgi:CubicO group peptidase (beta-lactamase class C family)